MDIVPKFFECFVYHFHYFSCQVKRCLKKFLESIYIEGYSSQNLNKRLEQRRRRLIQYGARAEFHGAVIKQFLNHFPQSLGVVAFFLHNPLLRRRCRSFLRRPLPLFLYSTLIHLLSTLCSAGFETVRYMLQVQLPFRFLFLLFNTCLTICLLDD